MSRRPPVTVLPLRDAVGAAESSRACLIWAELVAGLAALSRAAAPVTGGVAMEVPL